MSELTVREKWLMAMSFASGMAAVGEPGFVNREAKFEEWLDASSADAVTVEMVLEREAPPSELATLRARLSEVEGERDDVLKRLEWSESTNNLDAKRLRRLAVICGTAPPESDETLLNCAGTVLGSICRAVEPLFNDLNQTREELEREKEDNLHSCRLVAKMHHAATGSHDGPSRGVVEDVEDLRQHCRVLAAEVVKAHSHKVKHADNCGTGPYGMECSCAPVPCDCPACTIAREVIKE